MAESNTFTFRPRKELEGDWRLIVNWCEDPQINMPISAVFNSLLPALAIALNNNTIKAKDGSLYVNCDFGNLKICNRTEHQ